MLMEPDRKRPPPPWLFMEVLKRPPSAPRTVRMSPDLPSLKMCHHSLLGIEPRLWIQPVTVKLPDAVTTAEPVVAVRKA